ncbi:MAG: hypothetical protein IPK16_05230 [Anaerolineales bacterium]|nr:hypothetical protein [Anaerolineales bacterium]
MQSRIGHIQFNVKSENLPFYKSLLNFLGWQVLYDAPEMLGVGESSGASLWFAAGADGVVENYDGPGLNHLGLNAESIADVDALAAHLAKLGILAL